MLQTEHPNLKRLMHYLNTAYTVWTNKRNRRTGHLFEGRYKAIVMQEEGYLLSVTGYVHLNPVRVSPWRSKPIEERMKHAASYPWSRYKAYTKTMPKGAQPEISCDRAWGELGERDLAMYLCRQTAEKSLREIGEAFGIGPAAVGHAITRAKQRTKEDKRFARSVAGSKEALIRLLET